eukprot:CAMPEP_0113909604 /NCGR_PEP_ID=MMETSP0780_2-20120614/26965_1 /TAXON_ID=652834 /ORGANISM="Palpitomonas bilix" /LENGTH=253 /DNA_ID=CAMNT_0000905473 /DNA_START=106 /DNA_END=867 /DNA_ORIENTATION=+ /assembly_acc=CAM_ASM_000599
MEFFGGFVSQFGFLGTGVVAVGLLFLGRRVLARGRVARPEGSSGTEIPNQSLSSAETEGRVSARTGREAVQRRLGALESATTGSVRQPAAPSQQNQPPPTSSGSSVVRVRGQAFPSRCRITLSTQGILFSDAVFNINEDTLRIVKELLAAGLDVYPITLCNSDSEEAAARSALLTSGLIEAGLLAEKLLFTSTTLGRTAIARELEVHTHIDDSEAVVEALYRFVPSIVQIDVLFEKQPKASNVTVLPALIAYF